MADPDDLDVTIDVVLRLAAERGEAARRARQVARGQDLPQTARPDISGALRAAVRDYLVDELTGRATLSGHLGGRIVQRNKLPDEDLARESPAAVSRVCLAIADDPEKAFAYTIKSSTVAIVTDGSAVLDLGDIGPEAALPAIETDAMLLHALSGLNAFPLVVDAKDPDEIVDTVTRVATGFGGIDLEAISSPRCHEIEARLDEALDIPVMHGSAQGVAIVALATVLNAMRLTGKRLEDLRVVVFGIGAGGVAVTRLLLAAGASDIVGFDAQGPIHTDRPDYVEGSMPAIKRWYAEATNAARRTGVADVADDADLLVNLTGVQLPHHALVGMSPDAVVFSRGYRDRDAEQAHARARIVATARVGEPNYATPMLAVPGVFGGAFDTRAPTITTEMKLAAADAIAKAVPDDELREDHVLPSLFGDRVATAVSAAVAAAARRHGAVTGLNPSGPPA